MANFIAPTKQTQIAALLINGYSIREVCGLVGVAKQTVNTRRKALLALGVTFMPCACGLPAGHKAWCAVRYADHPKRQDFMRRWHQKQIDRANQPRLFSDP